MHHQRFISSWEFKIEIILTKSIMKFLFLFLVATSASFAAIGQNDKPRTPTYILTLIKQSKMDTNQVKLQLELGQQYLDREGSYKSDLDSALIYLIQAKKSAFALHANKLYLEILKTQGDCYLAGMNYVSGSLAFMEVINYYKKRQDKLKEAQTWQRFGDCTPAKFLDQQLQSYHNAAVLFSETHQPLDGIKLLKELGDAHLRSGNLDLAEKELLQVVSLYKKNNYKKLYDTYYLLGAVYSLKGNISRDLYYKLETVKNMEANGDYSNADLFYSGLGGLYKTLDMNTKSIYYYKKAIEHAFQIKDEHRYYSMCEQLVAVILHTNDEKYALSFLIRSIKALPPASKKSRYLVALSFALCYDKMGQFDKAEQYYKKGFNISDSLTRDGDSEQNFQLFRIISAFYINSGQYKKAVPYMKLVHQAPKNFFDVAGQAYIQLLQFKLDSANNRLISAIGRYQLYKELKDSVFQTAKMNQLQELEIKYETAQKEKQFKLLQANDKLKERDLIQAGTEKKLYASGLLMLLMLSGFIFSRYRIKQQANKQLEISQAEISAKNTALERLLRDNDWLLREVHHRVKNNLQIIMSLLTSQSAYLQDEAALNAVMESQHRVQAMSLIHQKLYKNNNITRIYMPDYINDLVDYLKDSYRINTVYFDRKVAAISLDVLQAIPIGLILNEIVTNAIKYAFPSSGEAVITVELKELCDDQILLVVEDNGVGLPEAFDHRTGNSFGIILVKGLVDDLEGTFQVDSLDGTRITIMFKKELNMAAGSKSLVSE
jgi:two-component sensor histidine kinase